MFAVECMANWRNFLKGARTRRFAEFFLGVFLHQTFVMTSTPKKYSSI